MVLRQYMLDSKIVKVSEKPILCPKLKGSLNTISTKQKLFDSQLYKYCPKTHQHQRRHPGVFDFILFNFYYIIIIIIIIINHISF